MMSFTISKRESPAQADLSRETKCKQIPDEMTGFASSSGSSAEAIVIDNVPCGVAEGALRGFLEDRTLSGGGDIKRLDLNKSTRTAVVIFHDPRG